MKIAIIVWDLTVSGGTQRQALELARFLASAHHEVKIYCCFLNAERCYPSLIKGLNITALQRRDYIEPSTRLRSSLTYPLEPVFPSHYRAIIQMMDNDFDLVNCHEHRSYRAAFLYKRMHGTPVVWMMNDLPASLIVWRAGKGLIGLVRQLHFLTLGGSFGFYVDRERIRRMDRIVVFDDKTRDAVRRQVGVGCSKVNSGLDVDAFPFVQRSWHAMKKNMKLLSVGVFFPHRRFEDTIRAVGALKRDGWDLQLDIVGSEQYDESYAMMIRNLVLQLGLSKNIAIHGAVGDGELRQMYSAADILVFANYPQTWGLTVFEAMSSGLPCIVSRGSGASSVLTNRENCLIADPSSPSQIAGAIIHLRDNPELYARLSINGRKFVEDNISWDKYGNSMLHIFEEVVAEKRPHGGTSAQTKQRTK